MDSVHININNSEILETGLQAVNLSLLAKGNNVEVMRQSLVSGAMVWVVPAENTRVMEFFFVHSGEIELTLDNETVKLCPGDSFYVEELKNDILLKTNQDTELIYITNSPMFDSVFGFQDDLTKLLVRINEKDDYTFRHSRNVMRYSVKLFENLPGMRGEVSLNDIVVSSLFHDVGKCFVPDYVLKKNARLDSDEMRYIIKHPLDSARLLRPHFGERVAMLAEYHHERLDGAGYPFGLEDRDIPPEARIIAVADVFDAMTTNRGYNLRKSFADGAAELVSLSRQYDKRVTSMLYDLVRDGEISENSGDEDEKV